MGVNRMDRKTGAVLDDGRPPKFIKNGESAMVLMTAEKKMVVEAYVDFPPLGRFAVRDMRQTVAVGIVKHVRKEEVAGTGTQVKVSNALDWKNWSKDNTNPASLVLPEPKVE